MWWFCFNTLKTFRPQKMQMFFKCGRNSVPWGNPQNELYASRQEFRKLVYFQFSERFNLRVGKKLVKEDSLFNWILFCWEVFDFVMSSSYKCFCLQCHKRLIKITAECLTLMFVRIIILISFCRILYSPRWMVLR